MDAGVDLVGDVPDGVQGLAGEVLDGSAARLLIDVVRNLDRLTTATTDPHLLARA